MDFFNILIRYPCERNNRLQHNLDNSTRGVVEIVINMHNLVLENEDDRSVHLVGGGDGPCPSLSPTPLSTNNLSTSSSASRMGASDSIAGSLFSTGP